MTGRVAVTASRLPLTERQVELLYLMSLGLTNVEIARRWGLALDTIKTHTSRLFARLDARNRAHAVRCGFERGLLGVERDDYDDREEVDGP